MPQDNPKGSNSNGDSADQPPSEKHQIAAAIQSLERQYRAAQEGHIQHEQQTFIWTRRAGVGVLAYTVLTVVIMCASIYSARQAAISADAARDSLSITRENFKADQRPIVWLTNNLGNPTWIQNKIVWSYHFTNYGKSPAANVRFDVNMSIDGSPFQDFGPIEKWRGTGAPVVPTRTTLRQPSPTPKYLRLNLFDLELSTTASVFLA